MDQRRWSLQLGAIPRYIRHLCKFIYEMETIILLLALKIEHPENVHLISGNHEAADINALFGFCVACMLCRMRDFYCVWL